MDIIGRRIEVTAARSCNFPKGIQGKLGTILEEDPTLHFAGMMLERVRIYVVELDDRETPVRLFEDEFELI